MTGPAIVILLLGMGGSWLARRILVRVLRKRHPETFARLGEPTHKTMQSVLPRHNEMHLRLWGFLWGFGFLALRDAAVNALAIAAIACEAALVGGTVLLFASALR